MAENSRGVWGPWKEVRCVLRQPGSQAERQGCGWRQSTGLLGSSLGFSASSFPTCRTLASPRFCLENLGPRVIALSRDPSHSLSHPGRSQPRVFQTASPLPARPPPRAEPQPRPRAPGPRPLPAVCGVRDPAPPPRPAGPRPRPAPVAPPLCPGGRGRAQRRLQGGGREAGGGAAPAPTNQRRDHIHANTSTMERAHYSPLQASLKWVSA